MSTIKKHLPLIVSIIVSALFLLSAVAKSFPIWAFEKQLVDLGIADWCSAPYLSRLIIAAEAAIAIAILQKHYIKTIVIPVTILLLVAFCVHLGIQMYEHGAMNGNCGCFGQLIPMTPLEAFLKNVVTILLLIYLYKNVNNKPEGENNFLYLLFIYVVSALVMFLFFPFCPCKDEPILTTPVIAPLAIDTNSTVLSSDTNSITPKKDSSDDVVIKDQKVKKDTLVVVPKNMGPTKVQSKFSAYTEFGGKKIDLNEGKKIVCLFVPGCDHCRDAAKEIALVSKKKKLPPIYILFMNEETFKIPEFFKETGMELPYFIIDDIPAFFKLLGNRATTPGIVYLWNGNIIKSYEGLESNKFNLNEMVQSIESDKY
jgi:hypothetical protein